MSATFTREQIEAMVRETLQQQAKLPPEKIIPSASIRSDLGIDSLDIVELMFDLEKRFEIVIPDERISRRHAVIQRQGTRFTLVDLGSTNGTFLNQTRIFKPTLLKDGDMILVGAARYTFRQEVAAGSAPDEPVHSTAVITGRTSCWMLVVVPPEPADAAAAEWMEKMREVLTRGGAGVKKFRGAAIFCHWREGLSTPEAMRTVVYEIAGLPRPPGARLAFHHGPVRIGTSANLAEENVLGPAVTFVHQMEASAAALGVNFLLSELAVQSLDLARLVTPLGTHAVKDTPGTHAFFALHLR